MQMRSLRSQMFLAMVTCVAATVTIAVSTTFVAMQQQDQFLNDQLSPRAVVAKAELEANTVPRDRRAFAELLAAQQAVYGRRGPIDRNLILTVAVLSLFAGASIALILANGLSRQLETVSTAARAVATGDFGARVARQSHASGEVQALARDFNAMADTLARAERSSVETAAAVAHELRTPLAVLQGRLQGMREGLFSSEPEDLDALMRQVELLGRIVSDLSLVSLASAGRLELNLQDADLAEVVAVLLRAIGPDLETDNLEVEADLQRAPAHADPDRMGQAILAMITNVRRHAAAGGLLRLETGTEAGRSVVRVLDRGPGLSGASEESLFQPFWRSDASRSRDRGGSGLGLAVVAGIASAHGGAATAHPNVGGGSVFQISVPTHT